MNKKKIETNHAKGEWKVIHARNQGIFINGDNRSLAHIIEPHNPDCEANAKLMAAAPELLEALYEVYNDYNTISVPSSLTMDLVNNAIKKATG